MKINKCLFSNHCCAKISMGWDIPHNRRITQHEVDGVLGLRKYKRTKRVTSFKIRNSKNDRFRMKQRVGGMTNAWSSSRCIMWLISKITVLIAKSGKNFFLFLMLSRPRIRERSIAQSSDFFVKPFGKRVFLASHYYNHWSANFLHQNYLSRIMQCDE